MQGQQQLKQRRGIAPHCYRSATAEYEAAAIAVGLAHLLDQGFVFVRLDKIELKQIK